MDSKVKKTAIIGGIVVVAAGVVAAICYYARLLMIYSKISSIAEAEQLMQSPNTLLISLYDPQLDVSTDGTAYQYSNTGSDDIDAVSIGGDIYTGDATTAIYYDTSGNTYNGNNDTNTDMNGNVSLIDPSSVIYGTLQSNGVFTQD